MKHNSELKNVLGRMVLLMSAGVAAGMVLTDAVNKVGTAVVEIRGAYNPFVDSTRTGWTRACATPAVAAISAAAHALLIG